MKELLPEVNAMLEIGAKSSGPIENIDSQLSSVPEVVNVTIPGRGLQKSRIFPGSYILSFDKFFWHT